MPIDSFASIVPPSITTVNSVEVILNIYSTSSGPTYTARYGFDQLAADGSVAQVRAGNLIPHLTVAQRNAAMAFMNDVLTKARGSV